MEHNIQLSITSNENATPFFIASTASDSGDVLSITAIGGYVLYLQNTSTKKIIIIDEITASASTPGVVLRWVKNVEIGVIDNAELKEPVNISGKEKAEAICYKWDGIENGIVGIDDEKGAKVKTYILDIGHTSIKTKASLRTFDNIALHFKHPEGAPDVECGIQFSYQDIEEPENAGN